MKRYIEKKEQQQRAQLITPFFLQLKTNEAFMKEIKSIREKFGITQEKPPLHEAPLYLLRQNFWKRDYDIMQRVKLYSLDDREIWEKFHHDIEKIAKKYKLSNFLDYLKDFIFSGKFWDALTIYSINLTSDGHTITIPTDIKKKDFDRIWLEIVDYNKKYPYKKRNHYRFNDQILKKYESVEKFDKKYSSDQICILLFIKQQLQTLTKNEEDKLNVLEKSQKSRLRKIAMDIFSLVCDLDEAER